jgi:hypothetical protein
LSTGRTLLRDNIYIALVRHHLPHNEVLQWVLFALAASYYKEFFKEGSQQKKLIRTFESKYLQWASKALRQNIGTTHVAIASQDSAAVQADREVRDVIHMLYVHHVILNPNSHVLSWTEHLYELGYQAHNQASVVLAAHSIWLMALLPLTDDYPFQKLTHGWIGADAQTADKIHGIVGCSESLLLYEYVIRVTARGADRIPWGFFIMGAIDQVKPWVESCESNEAKEIAMATQDAYADTTRLYAYVRSFQYIVHLTCEVQGTNP